MIVRMLVHVSGTRNGEPWPAVGDTIDVPADEAQSLIDAGIASADAKVQQVETAAAGGDVETAADTSTPKRRR